jgi:8-oxo-dGTP pyrophosphatase MutT (NUDIX family)
VKVKVRALVVDGARVLVAVEQRRAEEHLTVPGGRVNPRETLAEALAREVLEETGAVVGVGELLYVAEIVTAFSTQELNLVFGAQLRESPEHELCWLAADDPRVPRVMPPLLPTVFADVARGEPRSPRWLGNLAQADHLAG